MNQHYPGKGFVVYILQKGSLSVKFSLYPMKRKFILKVKFRTNISGKDKR